MALTYATLFNTGPLVWQSAQAKAAVLTAITAQVAWPATAVATPEHGVLRSVGDTGFLTVIGANGAIIDAVTGVHLSAWADYAARYIRDNEATYDSVTSEIGSLARALIGTFITDSQTIDACTPTAGTVIYSANNQGDGTATMAINSNTATLAELALAGTVELECIAAGFSVQNAERWVLRWRGVNPRTGDIIVRTSASRNGTQAFTTAVRYFDVQATLYPGIGINPSALDIIPQRGAAIHTGLNCLVSVPTYTPSETTGDADSVMSAVSVNLVDGAKSNMSLRNTTSGTFYLRIVKSGSDYLFTWYQDSGFLVALTNTITLTTGSGTATQTWTAAATNPEHVSFGGHLTTSSNFVSATVAAGSLTQSATVIYTANLPWAVGDKIQVPITNSYAGIYQRFFVEELGFPLPSNAAAGETIADPSA